MIPLQLLVTEFAVTVTNGQVWLSIGLALLLGAGCLAFGTSVARLVGLLSSDAPAGETLGVGLAVGLMVVAAWWAAVWSAGRSSFTPVAIGFAVAIGLGLARRLRRRAPEAGASTATMDERHSRVPRPLIRRSLVLTIVAGGVFVVAVALLYGSTMVLSPRDGVQPVEFVDEAFYAVLGRELAVTGTETNLSVSGFVELPGVPVQVWYHWGELWLASAVIKVFGTAPLAARYFVVLPIVLLAAAALTGTVVRRLTGTRARRAYLFGVLACLFLAPVPLIPGPFFSSWAVGMVFGNTLYGLGAVAALLVLYGIAVLGSRRSTWSLAAFAGSAVTFVLPAHIAIALLGLIGLASVVALRVGRSMVSTRRAPSVQPIWRRALIASGVILVATVVFGLWTGHSLGLSGAPPIVSSFNESWRNAVAITALGGGAFFAILIAWWAIPDKPDILTDLYRGTMVILVVGAITWGAKLGDFTTFYLFFGGIAVFATPVAAVAVWTLGARLTAIQHPRFAAGLAILCVVQLEFGVVTATMRLQLLGPRDYAPLPTSLMDEIGRLPTNATLAYSCDAVEEVGFATPRLLSIDAHTGHHVVPMCFEAEFLSALNGADLSTDVENLSFGSAPQRAIYPDSTARPASTVVAAFLKAHGIEYIYADSRHPNTLVEDAIQIAHDGDAEVLQIRDHPAAPQ